MKRATIYARYSTDLQNDRSTADQIALCRQYAERNGMKVVSTFEDKAKSSASVFGRDGLLDLMAAAREGAFDVVLVEALDRLSRDQEDLAALYKRLSFAGIEIVTVHEGVADQVQIGIRGLLGTLFLSDLANKVRRGQAGRVREGKSAGGRAYGYRAVPGKPGEFAIREEEAETVRRIFREYVSGRSPREIAGGLNRDGVPPPRGTVWGANAIVGSKARQNGMLRNETYIGRIVWNRVHMVRDPDTGRRVSRENPRSEWQTSEAPALRIVDQDLWEAAQRRIADRTFSPGKGYVRRRRILSGLLRCGTCGSGMVIADHDHGRPRIKCSRATQSQDCANSRKYLLDVIEAVVVDALRQQLADPDMLAEYVEAFFAERNAAAEKARRERSRTERKLMDAKGALKRALDLYVAGKVSMDYVDEVQPRTQAEITRLEGELASIEPVSPLEIHPAAVAAYREDIASLQTALHDAVENNPDIAEPLRRLVQTVVVRHTQAGEPIEISITGKLGELVKAPLPPSGKANISAAQAFGGCSSGSGGASPSIPPDGQVRVLRTTFR